ncbi:MAG: hypothetical protein EOO25_11320 [Comamonadaceae bacterium]|nr:MAG: hypothetical protein EOO25_11320 [Comamonadaceae bacterium]
MASTHGTTRPAAFTYCLQQLPVRDEIVFKSVLRVLQGKTRHAWEHTDASGADLVIRGAATAQADAPATFSHSHTGAHPDINVSTSAGTACRALAWPLRIADLIHCLDQAGDEIAGLARRAVPSRQANPPAPVAQPVPPDAGPLTASQRMTLVRWPGPDLLQRDIRFLKLATMLTGQPVSVLEMAERSGFPAALCRDFAEALQAASLVRLLGDGTAGAGGRHAADSAARASGRPHPAAQPGLIARIRQRLEMIVGAPAR